MLGIFGKITRIIPIINQVIDVVDAITDAADDAHATPEEIARVTIAVDALVKAVRGLIKKKA